VDNLDDSVYGGHSVGGGVKKAYLEQLFARVQWLPGQGAENRNSGPYTSMDLAYN